MQNTKQTYKFFQSIKYETLQKKGSALKTVKTFNFKITFYALTTLFSVISDRLLMVDESSLTHTCPGFVEPLILLIKITFSIAHTQT